MRKRSLFIILGAYVLFQEISLATHKDGDPAFLVYQPIFGFTSNHRLLESPHLNEPGVWLVTNTPEGYRRRPVVTNPVSLVARNPVGTLLMGFNGLERLHRESMRGEVATRA